RRGPDDDRIRPELDAVLGGKHVQPWSNLEHHTVGTSRPARREPQAAATAHRCPDPAIAQRIRPAVADRHNRTALVRVDAERLRRTPSRGRRPGEPTRRPWPTQHFYLSPTAPDEGRRVLPDLRSAALAPAGGCSAGSLPRRRRRQGAPDDAGRSGPRPQPRRTAAGCRAKRADRGDDAWSGDR